MLTRPAKARQAVSGDGDRFELSSKGGRRWERQEQCQLFDVAEFCTGITVMFVTVCVYCSHLDLHSRRSVVSH